MANIPSMMTNTSIDQDENSLGDAYEDLKKERDSFPAAMW